MKGRGMKDRRRCRKLGRLVTLGLAAAAIVAERRKPPDEREWHGRLGGIVPYDFRRPTLERVKASLWDPESSRLVTPQVFGVGWTLNLGRVVRLVQERRGAA